MNTNEVPGFGSLGEDPAEFERRRIANLNQAKDRSELVVDREPDREIASAQAPARRLELTEALKPLIAEAFGNLVHFLGDLKADIQAQTNLMRHLDVPMEAIVDSHERASESFETLRHDLQEIGMEAPAAIKDLARVMDTAGLNEAQSRAEKRFEVLARMIEGKLDAFLSAQAAAFKTRDEDMVKILHLLERLLARELREAKRRVKA